jgi:hypothetical protein
MPDNDTPSNDTQQVETQTPVSAPVPPVTGQEELTWMQRYQGMTKVLAERDKEVSGLKQEKETLAATLKQVQDQATAAQAALDAEKLNLTQQIEALTGDKKTADQQLAEFNAYKVKMEALKAFPDLLPVADTIPSLTDPALMKQHLETLQQGVDAIAAQKAQRMTAGLTPGPASSSSPAPKYAYTDAASWAAALKQAAGKPEFAELDKAYMAWFSSQPN